MKRSAALRPDQEEKRHGNHSHSYRSLRGHRQGRAGHADDPIRRAHPEELIAAAHAGCFTMALAFALAKQGITNARLETAARVKLEPDGDGFKVSRSDLDLTADVPDLDDDKLRDLAEDAKKNCPISTLLDADMDLTIRTGAEAAA